MQDIELPLCASAPLRDEKQEKAIIMKHSALALGDQGMSVKDPA